MPLTHSVLGQNGLLADLKEGEYDHVVPYMKLIHLRPPQILIHPGERTRHIYFPINGLVSTMVVMRNGGSVEVCLTGREGCVDVAAVLSPRPAPTEAIVQVEGSALQLPREIVAQAAFRKGLFGNLLQSYIHAQFMQVSLLAACHRLHTAEQRLARWLLMTQDRLNSDVFPITHELLGRVLGTKRATVSVAASHLQRRQMIGYTHGLLRIRQRKLLERMSCECYSLIREFAGRIHLRLG